MVITKQSIRELAAKEQDFVMAPQGEDFGPYKYSRDATGYDKVSMAIDDTFSFRMSMGYPMLYLDDYNNIYCAECAKREFLTNGTTMYADIYYEGEDMYCDDCQCTIESAYGDPNDEE